MNENKQKLEKAKGKGAFLGRIDFSVSHNPLWRISIKLLTLTWLRGIQVVL